MNTSQSTAIRATADFRDGIRVPLADALHASVHVLGRSGLEACKHAVILMAQSARKMTKKSAKTRKIGKASMHGGGSVDYFEVYRQPPKDTLTIWLPSENYDPGKRAGMIRYFTPIKNSGLAKSSWFWGGAGRPAGGDVAAKEQSTTFGALPDGTGWQLTNKLGYITHPNVLPRGWEATVEQNAASRIMHEVARRVFPAWVAEMREAKRSGRKPINRKLLELPRAA